jgi:DNA invertase Pin-like site-specific DNA recombinase
LENAVKTDNLVVNLVLYLKYNTMIVKYQRTSTSAQHGKRFEKDNTKYDLTLFDQGISGTVAFKSRTNGKKVIELVESGKLKELVVEELRDIGRNMVDTINTLDWLDKNEVTVVIRSMGNLRSRVNGKRNEIWGLISSVMSSLYAMELENLKIRTEMGRKVYVLNGGKLGREAGTNETIKEFMNKPKCKEIVSLLKKGKTVRDIAARLEVSLNLVVKVRKHYNQPNKELV